MHDPPGESNEPAVTLKSDWTGGELCLDFANTLGSRLQGGHELFASYSDLLLWSTSKGAVSATQSQSMQDRAALRPAEGRAALDRALELRECLYRLFSTLARGEGPPTGDLALVNRSLSKAMPHRRVAGGPETFAWAWGESESALQRMLWPVITSAADLLVSTELVMVRQCASTDCQRLFVDRSRTRRRRWCDMKTCGNRAKARRHQQRRKGRTGPSQADVANRSAG